MYRVIFISVVLFVITLSGYSQKKELDEEAYKQWRRVDNYELANNGAWVKFRYMFYDNDSLNSLICNTYYFYELKSGRIRILRDIDSPEFFAGGNWIAFFRIGGDGTSVRVAHRLKDGFEIHIHADAELNYVVPQVAYKEDDRLIILNVAERDSTILTGVLQYCLYGDQWKVICVHQEDQGYVLRYGGDGNSEGKVLYVDKTRSLDNFYFYEGKLEGNFFVCADTNAKEKQDYYTFSLTDGNVEKILGAEQMARLSLDKYSIQFLEGNKRFMYQKEGVQRVKPKKQEKDESFQLELWSWHDPVVPSEQAKGGFYKKRSQPAIYLYDRENGKDYKVCEENHSGLYVAEGENPIFAYEKDEKPYLGQKDWRHDQRFDLYLVDLRNGNHHLLAKELTRSVHWSPQGDHLLYFDNAKLSWIAVNPLTRQQNILTDVIPFALHDELYDRPNPAPPYGLAGWSRDGKNAIVYDRFDIWVIHLDEIHKSYCWTKGEGRKNNTILRLLDPGRNGLSVDLSRDNKVEMFDWKNKNQGLGNLSTNGKLTPLVQGNFAFSVVQEAKNANTMLCMKQSYADDRDLWVCDGQGRRLKKVTDVNPQQCNYKWGSAQLVEWTNYKGKNNQGILYLPDGYDKNKSYPTIVTFYETHSSELHIHPVPGLSQAMIDIPTYVSRGYVVFQPDVYIAIGKPGESAYDAVVSGTRALADRGIIDSCRVGLQGHSWSGFLVAYLVSRTDLFKCVNIGAATVNLTSVYTALREGSGQPNMFMFEDWQCRMGATLWEDLDSYIANSPLLFADKIHTPTLIFHCDQDEAVSFYDGRNLFLALRRLQRPVWMLNYMGQGHFLTSRPAEVDWTIRLQQFFDHYLKDIPMPRWMKEGININERGVDQKYDLVE